MLLAGVHSTRKHYAYVGLACFCCSRPRTFASCLAKLDFVTVIVSGVGCPKTLQILDKQSLDELNVNQLVLQCWPPNLFSLLLLQQELKGWKLDLQLQNITEHGSQQKPYLSVSSSYIRTDIEESDDRLERLFAAWPLAQQCAADELLGSTIGTWRSYLDLQLEPHTSASVDRC